MSSLRAIVGEVFRIVMALAFLFLSVGLMYIRARQASDQREHKAGIQTLFSGKK